MVFQRRTIAHDVSFEGLGLHSGVPVKLALHPGENGICFIHNSTKIAAHPKNVTDTRRCTKLGSVSTVEHLMSALAGIELTDLDIEVTGDELPAMDGSAASYVDGLLLAGISNLGEASIEPPFKRILAVNEDAKIAIGTGSGHWLYEFSSDSRWPYQQTYETRDVGTDYKSEIAPCRTWGFEDEVAHLQAAGLARGLDLTKALVLGLDGYVNPPKFPDEPARHKMLDLIGDLYLSGIPIRFLNVSAQKSGHKLNVQAAAILAETAGRL